jgi:beta-mannosidase
MFWCGNNEIQQGINEWGWSTRHKSALDMYKEIFETSIPKLIEDLDPDTSYIPSSPMASQYAFNEGDVHYWTVWWGGSSVDQYEQRVGLFNSEYGMQSLLPMSSMKQFLNAEDLKEDNSPGMLYRNKMRGGSDIVEKYTK